MKYLVIGTGSIGARHIRNLAKLDKSGEFVLLRSSKKNDYVETLKKEFGKRIMSVYSYEDALKQEYDGCLICNPTSMHVQSALKVIEKCKAIMIEKPLSNSMEGVDELMLLAEKHKTKILIAYCLRWHPVVKKLKELMDAKELGNILSARSVCNSYLPEWRREGDYRKSYSASKELGGGVILDVSHELDYVYWLFGKPLDVKAVSGKVSELEIETEDFADILFQYKDKTCSIHLDYFGRKPRRTFEAICERGSIFADLIREHIRIIGEEGVQTIDLKGKNRIYEEEAAHFLQLIKGKTSMIGLEQGIDVLELCLKAKNHVV